MAFWSDEQLASIDRMLNPRSIAVVGATPRMQYGGRFLAAAMGSADQGVNVYPVNPRYEEVQGVQCYPSVSALPEAPDVVGVVVPYHAVLDTLRESHEKGAKSAIVISAGFAERAVDDRRDLQGELGRFARESGMRVSGPNCLGLANLKDDIWASASSRGASGLSGPIGLVCQSGASAFGPFMTRAVDEGIGFTYIVSTGNEADLDFCDFARYLLDDDDTRVIAGFVEGFKDGRKFLEVARLAAERGKPIVLIKIGRSDLGSRAAGSHTAALTGVDEAYEAAFAQYGVIRVQDYDDLLQVSNLMARCPRPSKRGVAVVSHSGGISSLTADMFGQAGLDLPPLSERAQDGINGILKGFGWAANPSDVTGFANSDEFPAIMSYMAEDEGVGTLVVASAGADPQATQVIAQRDASGMPVAFLWTGTRGAQSGLPMLRQAGIPVFYVPDKLAAGVRYLNDYHDWRERRLARGFAQAGEITDEQAGAAKALEGSGALSEYDSKALVRAFGVPTTREEVAADAESVVAAAERIGYPVALKVNSADILHKTEAGGIRLGLGDAEAVRNAFGDVTANARAFDANARIDGTVVQEMVSGGVETIVGVSYDAQLGPILLFGTGGVMVEVYNDVALRLCPITREDALEMIDEVKGARLLSGFRGAPVADVDALADVLVNVSQMAVQLEGSLGELDINPLMVLPKGQGVKAADALVVGTA
ncbi:Acetate--CoA ligase [ADP-forming] I [Geodia barretti]|uniref:Acetate--CoA ligase [ADP-forming] I n=1 Tax=Geodia barretti TaxID=519541 RepID=A0AA35WZH2_GEOBA|nr:Acetate--CoA ligase [ADP-forming] I [Geodia barretti]